MRRTEPKIVATLGMLSAAGLMTWGALAADLSRAVLIPPAAIGTSSTAQPSAAPAAMVTSPAVKKTLTPGLPPLQNPQPTPPKLNVPDRAKLVTDGKSYTVNINVLEQRVSELEQKLENLQRSNMALQQQQATHTHSYRAPMCQTFVSLSNLQIALNDPSRYPAGTGACLNRFTTSGVPQVQTSAPGK